MPQTKPTSTGRLDAAVLERFLAFADQMLELADELATAGRPGVATDGLAQCGTAAAAQMYEADEAFSRADFVDSVAIAAQELSKTRFWLQLFARRRWLSDRRIAPLLEECLGLVNAAKAMALRSEAEK